MSFNIALSGVAAAQKDLDTTANNIANVNTVGFKESRAEFGDVYAASLLSGSRTKVGDGVLTTEVAQQFSQGSLQFTNNALDLAVTGTGFFATIPDQTSRDFSFTRAGQFKLNDDNFVVNSNGDHLLGFPVNVDGTSSSVALSTSSPVRIPDSSGSPTATSEVNMRMNLPAAVADVDPLLFNPQDPTTYNASTSVTIYDSLGDSHVMTYYFMKDAGATNEWLVTASVDDVPIAITDDTGSGTGGAIAANTVGTTFAAPGRPAFRMVFGPGGDFQAIQNSQGTPQPTGNVTTMPIGNPPITNGASITEQISLGFALDALNATPDEPTQFASNFEVTSLEQNGLPVGRLTGIEIGVDGLVRATFSNGTSTPISRIALARFANEQGLTQAGNTQWKESISSGEALAGEATTGTFGSIRSSALEQANVNLTTELIDMIVAQRNFQANSRALEVNNSLNQTILNIR